MRKTSQELLFSIFAVLLFFFIFAFTNVWNNSMNDIENETADQRWLIYSTYLLSAYSIYIWLSIGTSNLKGFHLLCLLWCFIMPFVILLNHGKFVEMFQTILWALLFEASYLLIKKNRDNLNKFRTFFFLVAIYGGFFFFQSRIDMFMHDLTQSNTIYFVFLTLPWLLLVKRKTTRLFFLILFTALAIWSLKRSMLLSVLLIWASYVLSLLRDRRRIFLKLSVVVVLIVGGIFGYSYGDELLDGELSERVNREETDEGRNRLAIWTVTWSMIENSSKDALVLGHGHFGVRRDSLLEISAHNDFLEVIYDYGLVIFVLYIGLWVYVVKRCIKLYRDNSELFLPYAVSLSIFLVMSMVSHLILYTSYFNYLVLFWGSLEGGYFSKSELKKAFI